MVESENNMVAIRARRCEEHLGKRFKIQGIWVIINHGFQKAQGRIREIRVKGDFIRAIEAQTSGGCRMGTEGVLSFP